MPVNVGGAIDNLVLRMQPMGTMTGRVVFAPGLNVPGNARLDVSLEPANGDPTAGFARALAQRTDAEYSFTVRRSGSGAVTVPLTVTDGCGEWKTFVGGGAGAF